MGDKSGIYFGWRNSKCFYVGRSSNIKNRLRSHQIISLSDDVSWLEMPDEDTHANELFYIWLLQPESNGQMKAAVKSIAPTPTQKQFPSPAFFMGEDGDLTYGWENDPKPDGVKTSFVIMDK
jgi:hypothetical protein